MNILIPLLAGLVVLGLVWLVVTPRVKLPLLFDAGLVAVTFGTIALADGAMQDTISRGGSLMIGAGIMLLVASYVRQVRKYNRKHRCGNPREIDGRELRNIPGGKQ